MKLSYIFNSKQIKLLYKCTIFVVPFIAGLVFFYFAFYRDFKSTRDLGALGMIKFIDYQNCVDTLSNNFVINIPRNMICNYSDSCYAMSIGDSFSQQGIRGYMNYLAHLMPAYRFGNVKRVDEFTPEYLFIELCESSIPLPPIVIIESVERSCIGRLCGMEFNKRKRLVQSKSTPIDNEKKNDPKKHFFNWAQEYYKKRLGIDNPVGYYPLNTRMFSCPKHEKDLFFINSKVYGDTFIDSDLAMSDSLSIVMAQMKLDSLFNYAQKHGVELFYIVAADKYDVYQEYIAIDHPKKITLDYLAEHFKENKHFINSKELILPYIHFGEKDMYYCDDTHWSTKSAKLVGEEIARRISE